MEGGRSATAQRNPCFYFVLRDFHAHAERSERGGSGPLVVLREGRVADRNLEACRAGVRRGQPEAQARQACPRAQFVPYVASLYRTYADDVMAAAHALSPVVEPNGDAAAWLELGLHEDPKGAAERLAHALVPQWGEELCIGLGPNPWMAWLAAAWCAPRQGERLGAKDVFVRFAALGQEAESARPQADAQLAGLPVALLNRMLPGVAPRLQTLGLHTFGDVAEAPPPELRRVLGETALAAQGYSRGEDGRRLQALWPRPAVAGEWAFLEPQRGLEAIPPVLDRLAGTVAHGLRDRGQACRAVELEITTETGQRRRARRRFPNLRTDDAISHALHFLWVSELWPVLERGAPGELAIVHMRATACDLGERPWQQMPLWVSQSSQRAGPAPVAREGRQGAASWGTASATRSGRSAADSQATAKLPLVVHDLQSRFPVARVGFASAEPPDWREQRLAFWDPLRSRAGASP